MSAEQGDVAAIREALNTARYQDETRPSEPLAALDRLAAALERAERERDSLNELVAQWEHATEKAERALAEMSPAMKGRTVTARVHEHTGQPDVSEEQTKVVVIVYTNYRGETSMRHVLPRRVWFGESEWHHGEQWFLEALDLEKEADRSFSLKDVRWIGNT